MKFLFPAFIFLLMLSITPSAYAQKSDAIQVIRERLFYQDFDQARSFEFHDYIVSLKDSSSTVKAYQAAAAALVAKHAWNPIIKYDYLNRSQKLLKEAVTADELNIEIRFLRLYIENSIPSYLRKEDNKKEDKRTIITHIDKLYAMNIGNDISNYIIGYITSPKVCDPEEITMIRQRLKLN